MNRQVWSSVLDGRYTVEVIEQEIGQPRLVIRDDANGSKIIHVEETHWDYEPRWGADISDVTRWQERAVAFIDGLPT